MQTKTVKQILTVLKEDLEQLVSKVDEGYKQMKEVMEACRKAKHLARRRNRYYLNPHRYGRLFPDDMSKQHRKEARGIERKLETEFQNLLMEARVITSIRREASRLADCTVKHLQQFGTNNENLPNWLKGLGDRTKLLEYERSREIKLFEKTNGSGPTEGHKKSRGQKVKGGIKMAKKSSPAKIKELLTKLGKATDQAEKRNLRVELRSLGHKGGLGKGPGRPKKKAKKKKARKKAAA